MSSDSHYMIEMQNVSKVYRLESLRRGALSTDLPLAIKKIFSKKARREDRQELWALKDVSFQLRKGEALGIIGSNGAGKSTILKLLSNITEPTTGQVIVRGNVAPLIEVGAGFHPELSGRENVYLNAAILGMRKKDVDKKFQSIVEFAELGEMIDTPVKKYSSGMFVRLGYSVAIHVTPDILLIDEVLAVGDDAFREKCFKRNIELKKNGTAIILISHNLDAIRFICDRAVLLNAGRIENEGDVETIIREYKRVTKTS